MLMEYDGIMSMTVSQQSVTWSAPPRAGVGPPSRRGREAPCSSRAEWLSCGPRPRQTVRLSGCCMYRALRIWMETVM